MVTSRFNILGASIFVVSLFGCALPKEDDVGPEFLESRPPETWIRYCAPSWSSLVARSRPSAVDGRTLLLWARPTGAGGWTFEVAGPFVLERDGRTEWMVLEPDERTATRAFEGTFVFARCEYPLRKDGDGVQNSVERVVGPPERGELYKISAAHVPGGAKGNTAVRVLLVWRHPDGHWKILWVGEEAPFWNMGSFSTSDRWEFSVLPAAGSEDSAVPFSIRIDRLLNRYSSFEEDREAHPEVRIFRRGILAGTPPMTERWTTPWRHRVERAESWDRLAGRMAYYWIRVHPPLRGDRLDPGQEIDLPGLERP